MSRFGADVVCLAEIVAVNLALSGDNAVVVGMAVHGMAVAQRRIASAAGIGAAVLMQIVTTLIMARLLTLPAVSLVGGLVLGAIAVRLVRSPAHHWPPAAPDTHDHKMPGWIMTVIVGYFVMCPDNILAVAAVGRGHPWLLSAGVLLSAAPIILASLAVAGVMRRYPAAFTAAAGILGWIAGSMLVEAAARFEHLAALRATQLLIPTITAALVISSPLWWRGAADNRRAD